MLSVALPLPGPEARAHSEPRGACEAMGGAPWLGDDVGPWEESSVAAPRAWGHADRTGSQPVTPQTRGLRQVTQPPALRSDPTQPPSLRLLDGGVLGSSSVRSCPPPGLLLPGPHSWPLQEETQPPCHPDARSLCSLQGRAGSTDECNESLKPGEAEGRRVGKGPEPGGAGVH